MVLFYFLSLHLVNSEGGIFGVFEDATPKENKQKLTKHWRGAMRKSFLAISRTPQALRPGQTTTHKHDSAPSRSEKPLPPSPSHWYHLKGREEAFEEAR